MTLREIDEQLDHFLEYQKLKLDILFSDRNRWLYNKHSLPTFEYYLKNCVLDKGGKYDFSLQRYKTHCSELINDDTYCFGTRKNLPLGRVYKYYIHSVWMGTAFNFKEIVVHGKEK